MLWRSRGARGRASVILYISRPVRAFLARFSIFLLILFGLMAIFVSKVDSPFSYSVRTNIMDAYVTVADYMMTPVHVVVSWKQRIDDYMFAYSKNQDLSIENKRLKRKLSILSQVAVENEQLRKLLNFVERKHYTQITARVVGNASGPFIRTVLVNVGKQEGMEPGLAVIAKDGLVGRIIEVGRYSSRVMLLTDINSKIPVISSLSRERAMLTGKNTKYPLLNYLPDDTHLVEGEELVTSGDGDVFPQGLPVGLAYQDKTGKFFAKPYVQWHRLEYVSILQRQ